MNKDALLATLIGFGIGLFITGMLLLGPNLTKFIPKFQLPAISWQNMKNSSQPTPTPTPSAFSITIDSPLAEAIEHASEILVSGTASPGSTIIITGVLDEIVILAKDDGKYAGKITLIEGKNDITVIAYEKEQSTSQTVTVYYTPEEL